MSKQINIQLNYDFYLKRLDELIETFRRPDLILFLMETFKKRQLPMFGTIFEKELKQKKIKKFKNNKF